MKENVGVFICRCGPNLEKSLDIPGLQRFARGLPHVGFVDSCAAACAQNEQARLIESIRREKLTRVVFAGCSPKEHEADFRKIMEKADLNPYLMQTANIREICAWVVNDKIRATRKARDLIRAAANRVLTHDPIEIEEIDCQTDVLVVGGGVAGVTAALTLAVDGRKVHVVEKSPCMGGKAALWEDFYPDQSCAACLLAPRFDAVLNHDSIRVFTMSRLVDLKGGPGNFTAGIRQWPRFVDPEKCIGCGACASACPVSVPDEINSGLSLRKSVYIPYPGCLPNLAVIDPETCLRFSGQDCAACAKACPFEAVDFSDMGRTLEIQVGAVVAATGFGLFNPESRHRFGGGETANVVTSLSMERMLNSAGPFEGQVRLANGRPPRAVAFVLCVGSKSEQFNEHCSGVCCLFTIKQALMLLETQPDTQVRILHTDLCLPGKKAMSLFNRLAFHENVRLFRMSGPNELSIKSDKGLVCVRFKGHDHRTKRLYTDMAVLAPALQGADDTRLLAKVLDLSVDSAGFFPESDPVTDPTASHAPGVFLAGCCKSPMDIPSSAAEGRAAAGAVFRLLVPGKKLPLTPHAARVNSDQCSGCGICLVLCPFKAVELDPKNKCAFVQKTLCAGCGVCAAGCPSGAIDAGHFENRSIEAELAGLLADKP